MLCSAERKNLPSEEEGAGGAPDGQRNTRNRPKRPYHCGVTSGRERRRRGGEEFPSQPRTGILKRGESLEGSTKSLKRKKKGTFKKATPERPPAIKGGRQGSLYLGGKL